jgi:hypothetical protein
MVDQKQQKHMCCAAIYIFDSCGHTPNTACNSIPSEVLQLFLIYFLLIIFVLEANRCWHQHYAAKSNCNPAPHKDIFLFLALILKMGHNQTSMIHCCRTSLGNLYTTALLSMSGSIIHFFASSYFYAIFIISSYCPLCRSKGLWQSFSTYFCLLPTTLPPSTSLLPMLWYILEIEKGF